MSNSNPAKKIINDPLKCADELFEGLVLAYDGKARRVGTRSIVMNDLRPDAPALLVGGGAGHEPIYTASLAKAWPMVPLSVKSSLLLRLTSFSKPPRP